MAETFGVLFPAIRQIALPDAFVLRAAVALARNFHERSVHDFAFAGDETLLPKTILNSRCKFLAYRNQRRQSPSVRGSPLVRFILLTLALAATGLGLVRVTTARDGDKPTAADGATNKPAASETSVPYRLLLSAPAAEIEIDTGKTIRPTVLGPLISGTLEMDPKNPHVGLVVRWKNPATTGEQRFAKLTLEAPGQATFTHVFDAAGDIDDFLELPSPAPK